MTYDLRSLISFSECFRSALPVSRRTQRVNVLRWRRTAQGVTTATAPDVKYVLARSQPRETSEWSTCCCPPSRPLLPAVSDFKIGLLPSFSIRFGRECYLDSDRAVTCVCPPGYAGRNCDRCQAGYEGDPLRPGDACRSGRTRLFFVLLNPSLC